MERERGREGESERESEGERERVREVGRRENMEGWGMLGGDSGIDRAGMWMRTLVGRKGMGREDWKKGGRKGEEDIEVIALINNNNNESIYYAPCLWVIKSATSNTNDNDRINTLGV